MTVQSIAQKGRALGRFRKITSRTLCANRLGRNNKSTGSAWLFKGDGDTRWAKRLQRYFSHLEALVSPDLFVVGGGISKESDEFLPKLKLRTPIVAATLQNKAGIIGAARLAHEERGRHDD